MARPALGKKRPPRRRVEPLTGPPLGTYDPALNYQLRASQRGLADLLEDAARERQRGTADYRTERRLDRRNLGRQVGDLRREYGRGQQDIAESRDDLDTSFSRDLLDLATARQRGEEDYQRTLVSLQRQYAAQGSQQEQQARAQGVDQGGAVEASAAVRAANEGYDRSGIELEHARALEDLGRVEGQLREDYGDDSEGLALALQRLGQDFAIGSRRTRADFLADKRLDRRDFRRGRADLNQKVSRAKREQGLYEPSAIEQMYYQAHQLNPKIRFPRQQFGGSRVVVRPPGSGGTRAPRRPRR